MHIEQEINTLPMHIRHRILHIFLFNCVYAENLALTAGWTSKAKGGVFAEEIWVNDGCSQKPLSAALQRDVSIKENAMLRWFTFAVIWLPIGANAADLRAYTEEFPPFNYTENGANKGFANEVLNVVAARAQLSIERKIYPWPRSVVQSAADNNSLLFTTMRTPERESLYRWIGPIDDCDMVLLKLDTRKDIQIKNATDIARYRTGYARGVADEEVLKKLGVPESQRVGVSNTGSTMPMLFAGRIDVAAGVYLSHIYRAKQAKLAAERLQVAYVLQKGYGCYFAFNPKVDDRLFQRFNSAFETMKKKGEIDTLRDHLIKPPSK